MDALDEFEKRLAKFSVDSQKLFEVGEFLLENENLHICSAEDKRLLVEQLQRWTDLLTPLCYSKGMKLEEWLKLSVSVTPQESFKICPDPSLTLSAPSKLELSNFRQQDHASSSHGGSLVSSPVSRATPIISKEFLRENPLSSEKNMETASAVSSSVCFKSRPIPSWGNNVLPIKLFWQIEVAWPGWARQLNQPLADSKPNYWCFMCPCNVNPVTDGRIKFSAAANDLLMHICSSGHRKIVEGLQQRHLQSDDTRILSGRFFKECSATTTYVEMFWLKTDEQKLIKIDCPDRKMFHLVLTDRTPLYTTVEFQIRNISDRTLVLRYESCHYSAETVLQDFYIANRGSIMHSFPNMKTGRFSDFQLQPRHSEHFNVAILPASKLSSRFGVHFALFFLVAKLEENQGSAQKTFANERNFMAEPLIPYCRLCSNPSCGLHRGSEVNVVSEAATLGY